MKLRLFTTLFVAVALQMTLVSNVWAVASGACDIPQVEGKFKELQSRVDIHESVLTHEIPDLDYHQKVVMVVGKDGQVHVGTVRSIGDVVEVSISRGDRVDVLAIKYDDIQGVHELSANSNTVVTILDDMTTSRKTKGTTGKIEKVVVDNDGVTQIYLRDQSGNLQVIRQDKILEVKQPTGSDLFAGWVQEISDFNTAQKNGKPVKQPVPAKFRVNGKDVYVSGTDGFDGMTGNLQAYVFDETGGTKLTSIPRKDIEMGSFERVPSDEVPGTAKYKEKVAGTKAKTPDVPAKAPEPVADRPTVGKAAYNDWYTKVDATDFEKGGYIRNPSPRYFRMKNGTEYYVKNVVEKNADGQWRVQIVTDKGVESVWIDPKKIDSSTFEVVAQNELPGMSQYKSRGPVKTAEAPKIDPVAKKAFDEWKDVRKERFAPGGKGVPKQESPRYFKMNDGTEYYATRTFGMVEKDGHTYFTLNVVLADGTVKQLDINIAEIDVNSFKKVTENDLPGSQSAKAPRDTVITPGDRGVVVNEDPGSKAPNVAKDQKRVDGVSRTQYSLSRGEIYTSNTGNTPVGMYGDSAYASVVDLKNPDGPAKQVKILYFEPYEFTKPLTEGDMGSSRLYVQVYDPAIGGPRLLSPDEVASLKFDKGSKATFKAMKNEPASGKYMEYKSAGKNEPNVNFDVFEATKPNVMNKAIRFEKGEISKELVDSYTIYIDSEGNVLKLDAESLAFRRNHGEKIQGVKVTETRPQNGRPVRYEFDLNGLDDVAKTQMQKLETYANTMRRWAKSKEMLGGIKTGTKFRKILKIAGKDEEMIIEVVEIKRIEGITDYQVTTNIKIGNGKSQKVTFKLSELAKDFDVELGSVLAKDLDELAELKWIKDTYGDGKHPMVMEDMKQKLKKLGCI